MNKRVVHYNDYKIFYPTLEKMPSLVTEII